MIASSPSASSAVILASRAAGRVDHAAAGWVGRLGWVGVQRMLVAAIVVDAAYWTLWFAERSWVASSTRPAYDEFENAFPLADAWLAVALTWAWRNRGELLSARPGPA